MFDDIGERLLSNAQKIFFNDFRQGLRLALGFEMRTSTFVPEVICRAASVKAVDEIELLLRQAGANPKPTGGLRLAPGHQLAGQFEMVRLRFAGLCAHAASTPCSVARQCP